MTKPNPSFTPEEQVAFDEAMYRDIDRIGFKDLTESAISDFNMGVFVAPKSNVAIQRRKISIQNLSVGEARKLRSEITAEVERLKTATSLLQEADRGIRGAILGEAD